MSDFLMKPKIDYAFKEIMMDEQARIGFLSAVLNLNPADIRKTELLNTSLRKLHEDEKQGISRDRQKMLVIYYERYWF